MNSKMRDYEKLLAAGNKAQLEKLKENDHKDGFDNVRLWYAMCRIKDETDELECELNVDNVNLEAVRKEAADIANFAHMIILTCDKELNNDN